MVLAEALLRVPDAATADRLIEDKLATGDWSHSELKSNALLVSASAWTLGITARIIHPGETPETILDSLMRRLGLPVVRTATREAMRLLGSHFVLGQTIEEALRRATASRQRYSFDMLGEGARTEADMRRATFRPTHRRSRPSGAQSGRSAAARSARYLRIKLSALHPRFEAVSRARVLAELVPRVIELARMARAHDLNFTVDAEEADRLALSLDVIGRVLADPSLRGWEGSVPRFRPIRSAPPPVIGGLFGRSRTVAGTAPHGAPGQGRLLGYRDQARAGAGACRLSGVHPQGDDRSLLCGVRASLARGPAPYLPAICHPQNALFTVAFSSVIEDLGGVAGFELQRLHGMGEGAFYEEPFSPSWPQAAPAAVYALGQRPAADLLAYLECVALLENSANCTALCRLRPDSAVPIARPPQASAERDRDAEPGPASKDSAAARSLRAGAHQFLRGGIWRQRRARPSARGDRASRGRGRRRAVSGPVRCFRGRNARAVTSPIDGAR